MDFIGIWKNIENDELIEIKKIQGADEYELLYDYDESENDFKTSENIHLFKSGKFTRLPKSKKFGIQTIQIFTSDSFQVGNESFERLT